MIVEENLNHQIQVCSWIDKNLSIKYNLKNENERWAFSCFDMVVEHHSSILLLSQSRLYGSAFALLRVEFEAFVRGLWLRYVATESQLEKFKRDKVDPKFGELIEQVERKRNSKSSVLSYIKDEQWSIFNSFTHTGIEALIRRIGPQTTGHDNYNEEDVVKGLKLSGLIVVLAAYELALLINDDSLVKSAGELVINYRNDV